MLGDLLAFMDVPAAGKTEMLRAWRFGMSDFEDALQAACAEAGQADFIITRNTADFISSPVMAITPEQFLAQFPPA